MNNFRCILFGHTASKLILQFPHDVTIMSYDVEIAKFRLCKRCKQIYFETIGKENYHE